MDLDARSAPGSSARRNARAVDALGWAALVAVLLVPIWWGVDARAPWDVDHIAPGSVLKAMAARFGPHWHSSYGPVPYLVTAVAYAPLLIVFRVTGELGAPVAEYPWGFRHPEASVGALVIAARLVTLLLALGAAWLAARALRRFAGTRHGWLAPVLLLGSAVFAYYGRTTNVDLHVLFWLFLAFDLADTASSRARFAFAGAAAALAVCCKEQVAPLAAVAVVLAMVRAWRGPGSRRGVAMAVAVPLGAFAAYAIVWRLPWAWPGWVAHHRFLFEQAVYPRSFAANLAGYLGLYRRALTFTPLAFGLPILSLTVLAVLLRLSWRGLGARAVACLLYLSSFIGTIGYVYPRFLLPLLVLALPLAGRACAAIEEALARHPGARRLAGTALVALALAGGPVLSWIMLHDPRLAAERWLASHRPAGGAIEIAGNPHFQPRVPAGVPVVRTTPEALEQRPRPPRGALVVVSSIDSYRLQMDARVRADFWDALHDPPPGGYYERAIEFGTAPIARLVWGLPVAPTIWIYPRAASAPPPPPLDPAEETAPADPPYEAAGPSGGR